VNYPITYISGLLFLFGCSLSNPQKDNDNIDKSIEEINKNDTIHVLLEKDKYGNIWLDIIKFYSNNTIVFQTRRNRILSISGSGNTELVLTESGEIAVDTVDFGNDGKNEYVFKTFIKGSTYGASCYYIVYLNSWWEVFRVPFDRLFVKYDEGIGDYIIISYHANDSAIYRFDSGILTPLKKK